MKFLKIQNNDIVSFIDPETVTAINQNLHYTTVCCGFSTYYSEESAEDLRKRIEEARTKAPERSNPYNNFYCQTIKQVPTIEDGDYLGLIMVSDDTDTWFIKDVDCAVSWKYWAQLPRIEV